MRTHVQKVSMCRPSRARVSRARRHRVELQIGSLRDRFVFAPSKFKQQQRHVFTHTHTSMSRSARARAKRTGMSSHSYTHTCPCPDSRPRACRRQTEACVQTIHTHGHVFTHTFTRACPYPQARVSRARAKACAPTRYLRVCGTSRAHVRRAGMWIHTRASMSRSSRVRMPHAHRQRHAFRLSICVCVDPHARTCQTRAHLSRTGRGVRSAHRWGKL